MDVELAIVPPGGGEADYFIDADLPVIPRVGEYLLLRMKDHGMGMFRVLLVTHKLEFEWTVGLVNTARFVSASVQLEPVRHPRAHGDANIDRYFSDPRYSDKVHDYPTSGVDNVV